MKHVLIWMWTVDPTLVAFHDTRERPRPVAMAEDGYDMFKGIAMALLKPWNHTGVLVNLNLWKHSFRPYFASHYKLKDVTRCGKLSMINRDVLIYGFFCVGVWRGETSKPPIPSHGQLTPWLYMDNWHHGASGLSCSSLKWSLKCCQ